MGPKEKFSSRGLSINSEFTNKVLVKIITENHGFMSMLKVDTLQRLLSSGSLRRIFILYKCLTFIK